MRNFNLLTTNKKSILFTLLIAGAVAVNIYFLFTQSIRLDEAQSFWYATKPISAVLKMTAEDVHVPLYFIILHFWFQFFGTGVEIARILSFIFFIATVPFLYLLSKEASDKNVAILTVLIYLLSPFTVWYSSEARVYSLFAFLVIVNHLFFLRFFKSLGKDSVRPYFISSLLGIFTHYFFVLVLVSQGFFILLRVFVDYYNLHHTKKIIFFSDEINDYRRLFRKFIKINLGVFLFILPWLGYVVLLGGAQNTSPVIQRPDAYSLFQVFVNFLFGFQNNLMQSVLIALWPLFVVSILFVFTQRKKIPLTELSYFIVVTILPVILVFMLSQVRPMLLPRYLIFIAPTFFFVIAWNLVNYSKRVYSNLVLLVVFVMLGFLFYQNISYANPIKEDYKGVARFLEKEAKKDDIVLITSPFTIYPLEYSYKGITRLETIPKWDRFKVGGIPAYSEKELKKELEDYKKVYSNVFIVYSYNQGYEGKIKDYFEKNYKLVKSRNFTPGLYVREYKLRYDLF